MHHTVNEVLSVIRVMEIKCRYLKSLEHKLDVTDDDKRNIMADIQVLAGKIYNDNGK